MKDSTVNDYLDTLLWSSTLSACDEDGEPTSIEVTYPEWSAGEHEDGTPLDAIVDVSDLATIAPEIVKEAREDLEGFAAYCEETLGFDPLLEFDPGQVAHDFCLSRNGHGAGFFDGDYLIKEPSEELTALLRRSTWEGVKQEADGVQVKDALQEAAKTFGTHGIMLWVNEEGRVCLESHS